MSSVDLGANVASGVLGTCLVSRVPSVLWPPVKLKVFFAYVAGWDIESRRRVAVWAFGQALRSVSRQWAVSYLKCLVPTRPLVKQKSSAVVMSSDMKSRVEASSFVKCTTLS